MSYFKELVEFLKPFGDIYIVRVPIIEELHDIENQWMPQFDSIMLNISNTYEAPYINMMDQNAKYTYTDGNHLDFKSGEQFSLDLASRIKSLQKEF